MISFYKPQTRAQISSPEINIFLSESIGNISALTALENDLGLKFHSCKWYLDWSDDLEREIPDRFNAHGCIPELTWQPQLSGEGVSYNEVTSGEYDQYINSFASVVKGLGYNIRINMAPEMNSDWEPWSIGQNGNTKENHKDFWRYVVAKFRDNGATNISWIWGPNVHYVGELISRYSEMYPGDDYVDYVGLDGYNWGTSQSWSEWQTFREVFENSYNDLAAMTSKNILIMETASAEVGGNKADWITGMFNDLPSRFPRIKGFTWFDINKETDWRINSSESSKQAFARAAQGNTESTPSSTSSNTESDSSSDAQSNSQTAPTNKSKPVKDAASAEKKDNSANQPANSSTPTISSIEDELLNPIIEGAWAYSPEPENEAPISFFQIFQKDFLNFGLLTVYLLVLFNLSIFVPMLIIRSKKHLSTKISLDRRISYLDGIATKG